MNHPPIVCLHIFNLHQWWNLWRGSFIILILTQVDFLETPSMRSNALLSTKTEQDLNKKSKWMTTKQIVCELTYWRCSRRRRTSPTSPPRTSHRRAPRRSCSSRWTLRRTSTRSQLSRTSTRSLEHNYQRWSWLLGNRKKYVKVTKGWKTHHSPDLHLCPLGKSRCLQKENFSYFYCCVFY